MSKPPGDCDVERWSTRGVEKTLVHICHYRVGMRDTDGTGIVYHPRYLEILDYAREELLNTVGIRQDQLTLGYGVGFIVYNVALRLRCKSMINDLLRIETTWPVVTNQKIKSVQRAVNAGIVAVDCDVEFSVIDLKTGSAVLVPKEIKSLLSDRLAAQQALLAGKFS